LRAAEQAAGQIVDSVIEEIDDGRCGPTLLDRLPQALAGDDRGPS
jgi:hypothetical protein